MHEPGAILLGNDNAEAAELIHKAFARIGFGHDFHSISGGNEVLRYLRGDSPYQDRARFPFPHLLLLDFSMPSDGWEILQWIRQRPDFRRLPVIVFTGSNAAGDVDKAYELGANSYLVKPGGFDALLELMKTFEQYWFVYNERPDVKE